MIATHGGSGRLAQALGPYGVTFANCAVLVLRRRVRCVLLVGSDVLGAAAWLNSPVSLAFWSKCF